MSATTPQKLGQPKLGQPKLGPKQAELLARAVNDRQLHTERDGDQKAARALNARGYLRRDPKDGALWFPTAKADALDLAATVKHDVTVDARPEEVQPEDVQPEVDDPDVEPLDTVLAEIDRRDASGLVATIERARALLDDGDVRAAKLLASGAYREAKARAGFAAEFGAAGRRVVAKARQLQADALQIEIWAKIRIAKEYDRAQDEGRAAKKGRPKNVPDGNILPGAASGDDPQAFTVEEAGLTRKEIFEARKLADAEERTPGIVERAIAARLAAGLEPSRANLRAALGTRTATAEERGDNLYETPPVAVHALLALEQFSSVVLEPACGRGAISKLLEAAGHTVQICDLRDYGTADQFGELQGVGDFLDSAAPDGDSPDIVTNPPYGAVLNRFVAHALKVHRPRKMALLLNVNFYGGTEDEDRNFVLDTCPPARIWWFSRRLPMMHRDGWEGDKAGSQMNTGWFIWELQADGSYGNQTVIRRADWKALIAPTEATELAEKETAS